MRFPLAIKEIHGYQWGQPTWYHNLHLGTDWKADFVNLYAPCDGKITYIGKGPQAGKAIWFVPKGQEPLIIRWLHLDKHLAGVGEVKEGQLIARTGQSGSSAQASFPHLHEDIWPEGHVDPIKFDLTINPEVYWRQINMIEFVKNESKPGEFGLLTKSAASTTYIPASTEADLIARARGAGLEILDDSGHVNYNLARPIRI